MKIVKQDKYEVGDKVRLVDYDRDMFMFGIDKDDMKRLCGKTLTISGIHNNKLYMFEEDKRKYFFLPDMIEGKVIEYREVKRAAKVGEWVKCVSDCSKRGSMDKYLVGDVLLVRGVGSTWPGFVYTEKGQLSPREYVVLEGYEPPKATVTASKTKPETFTITGKVNGKEVTETINVPGVSKNKFESIYPNRLTEKCDKECRHRFSLSTPNPCATCSPELSNFEPKDEPSKTQILDKSDKVLFQAGENVKAGQLMEIRKDGLAYRAVPIPGKRKYTEAQIQEAKNISYRILLEQCGEDLSEPRIQIKCNKSTATAYYCTHIPMYSHRIDKQASSKCSDSDEPNYHIGVMVALCKLTGEKLPSWIKGDGK